MDGVRVISSSKVGAANHKEPNRKIDLSPWDLQILLLDSIQKGIFLHKPTPDSFLNESPDTLIQHLQTTFSRTLDFFPPLAGRFASFDYGDGTTSFYIDCNNEGALFVHAVADGVSVSDILDPVYVPDDIVYALFAQNRTKNHEGTTKPLLAAQITELQDGIFIGLTINHAVADGSSFWQFFNAWAEISRGSDSLANPPVLERWFLHETDCPVRIPVLTDEQLQDEHVLAAPLQQRVFHFPAENIAKLKAKAIAESGNQKISSLQAILSLFWRAGIRNKEVDPDEDTSFIVLIGARGRMQPPLPAAYFGNAVMGGIATLKAGEVTKQGLGYVASQLNKMIATYTEEKLRGFVESWMENPRLFTRGGGRKYFFGASSSPRHNVYGCDFGWGRPTAVRSGPGHKADGKITVFAGAKEGSIDIEACFSAETLKGLDTDAEFMEAVLTN